MASLHDLFRRVFCAAVLPLLMLGSARVTVPASAQSTATVEPSAVEADHAPMDRDLDPPLDPLAALRQIEDRVRVVVAAAGPATVGLDLGFGTGSGVVIDPQGTILTAAHVIGEPGRLIQVFFPDGTVATARTLGSDRQTDAGMARLQGEGPWPWVPRPAPGDPATEGSSEVSPGDWVVALGHPAGFDARRPVVARLGRVVRVRPGIGVQSDCVLIGGDSGGPLINLDGQVIGIHSRIGPSARTNIHVGMPVYDQHWEPLADGQRWGQRRTPLLGVLLQSLSADETDDNPVASDPLAGMAVRRVLPQSAADQAGLREADVIISIDGRAMPDQAAVNETMAMQEPGDFVTLSIWRPTRRGQDGERLELRVRLGARQ